MLLNILIGDCFHFVSLLSVIHTSISPRLILGITAIFLWNAYMLPMGPDTTTKKAWKGISRPAAHSNAKGPLTFPAAS